MERKVGTISRGVRCPIIREGDDLAGIVVNSVVEAAQAEGGSMALLNGASQVMNYYRDRAMVLYEELYQYDPDFEFSFQANG